MYDLRPPVVVIPLPTVLSFGPQTTLTYSRRGRARAGVAPPAVVFVTLFQAPPIQTTFVRIKPPPVLSALRPPIIVAPVLFFGPTTSFAPQRRGRPLSSLRPPQVVAQPELAFRPEVLVWLVRIAPPPIRSALLPPTVVIPLFVPQHGEVCGFDIASSFVCGSDVLASSVCGSDVAAADSIVCGEDRKAT